MTSGRVTNVNCKRQFFFIRVDPGDRRSDHFAHADDLVGVALSDDLLGKTVVFTSTATDRGLRAIEVRVVDGQ